MLLKIPGDYWEQFVQVNRSTDKHMESDNQEEFGECLD